MNRVRTVLSFLFTLFLLTLFLLPAINSGTSLLIALSVAGGVIGTLIFLFWIGQYISLSIQTHSFNVGVSPIRLARMKREGADPKLVVLSLIRLKQAGIEVGVEDLASAVREERDLKLITNAMIVSHKLGRPLRLEEASSLDRSGGLARRFEELNEEARAQMRSEVPG